MADTPALERHATWLELFYDLIYVVSIAAVTARFAGDVSTTGLLWFAGLLIAVWLSWSTHTYFATRFDHNTVVQRALTLLQMLGAAAMAVALSAAELEQQLLPFGLAYAFIKLCLIALYIDACRTNQAARTFSMSYLPVQAVSAVLWAIGALLEPQTAYWLWAAAVLIDLLVPSLFLTRRFRGMHVDTAHMPERFGLFTIIVLGEAILATVAGVHDVEFDFWSIIAAIAGFAVAVAIWANYFNYVERAPSSVPWATATGTPWRICRWCWVLSLPR